MRGEWKLDSELTHLRRMQWREAKSPNLFPGPEGLRREGSEWGELVVVRPMMPSWFLGQCSVDRNICYRQKSFTDHSYIFTLLYLWNQDASGCVPSFKALLFSLSVVYRMLVYLKLKSIIYPKKCSKLKWKVKRGASALLSTCDSVRTELCNPPSAAKNGHSKVNPQIPQSEAEGRRLELLSASPWHRTRPKGTKERKTEKFRKSWTGTL